MMIVRNIDDPEVLATTYQAHGGGTARMVMTSQFLTSIEFLAYACLPPGNVLEEHVDPVEEIYYILRGRRHDAGGRGPEGGQGTGCRLDPCREHPTPSPTTPQKRPKSW